MTCLFYRAVERGTVSARHAENFERFRAGYLAYEATDRKPHRAALIARDPAARAHERLLTRLDKRHLGSLVALTVDVDAAGMSIGYVQHNLNMFERQFREALEVLEEKLPSLRLAEPA